MTFQSGWFGGEYAAEEIEAISPEINKVAHVYGVVMG